MAKLRSKGCCDCRGCGLECRSKSGTATLCGFSEFTNPSTPPRKYRRKTITGKVTQCDWPAEGCQPVPCAGTYPPTIALDGTQVANGGRNYQYSAAAAPDHYDAATNRWIYHVTSVQVFDITEGTAVPVGALISIGSDYAQGATVSLPPCSSGTAFVHAYAGSWFFLGSFNFTTPPADPSTGGRRDEWGDLQEYTLPACTLVHSTAESKSYRFDNGCKASGGLLEGSFGPGTEGASFYGADVSVGDETPTRRTHQGIGCRALGGGQWLSTSGDLVEELSDEDTPQAAIERAVGAAAWGAGAQCQYNTAWTTPWGSSGLFSFRAAQVRGVFGTDVPLQVGATYQATIGFGTRPLGSGLEFVPSTNLVFQFLAEHIQEASMWFDVPSEPGIETAAITCALSLVTSAPPPPPAP